MFQVPIMIQTIFVMKRSFFFNAVNKHLDVGNNIVTVHVLSVENEQSNKELMDEGGLWKGLAIEQLWKDNSGNTLSLHLPRVLPEICKNGSNISVRL